MTIDFSDPGGEDVGPLVKVNLYAEQWVRGCFRLRESCLLPLQPLSPE